MQSELEKNIIDQINRWMQNSEEMSLLTCRLKDEICQTFGDPGQRPGVPTCRILPAITILKNNVYCDGILIPTAKKGRAIELFKAFLRRPHHSFTREELTTEIYGSRMGSGQTPRLMRALRNNTTKLISRSRVIAEEAVNSNGRKWIEWFCYDAERRLWSFYRITNARLLEIQNNLIGTLALPDSAADGLKEES